MPLKIIRTDITKMNTEAIVNTANAHPAVGTGCDYAIYKAAGYSELLGYRKAKIGFVPEGKAFITPGFQLSAKYIIHAVSPRYRNGHIGEELKLRSCYQNCLRLARKHGVQSIAFPLISTGGFGYPKEEGMRIAVDEINAFLLKNEMLVYIVVFGETETKLGSHLYPDLESYIDQKYVEEKQKEEYGLRSVDSTRMMRVAETPSEYAAFDRPAAAPAMSRRAGNADEQNEDIDFFEEHESRLSERIKHLSDTFSEYLIYLIDSKHMTYPEVYKRAIVDKKVFSKIKNNPDAHPKKITAMCLCVGAKLNLDETRDLLARAGYALSPCDKTDIIFSYFIEHQIYDMIELDIQLEEHGLPCLIS